MNYMLFIFSVIAFYTVFSSNAEPIQGNNINIAIENEFPYIVSLGLKRDGRDAVENHKCTGVLITKRHILTAAHCLVNRTLSEIQVLLGSIDLMNGIKYKVDFKITYNEWANNSVPANKCIANDIAIFRLSKEVDGKIAKPATRCSEKCDKWFGNDVVITGRGVPNGKGKEASRYLQKANVKVFSNSDCEKFIKQLKNTATVPKRLFCTKADPWTLLTSGDSGGPVIVNNSVIAINKGTCPLTSKVDLPEEFIKSHTVNVHPRMDYFQNFIEYVIKHY